MTEAELIEKIDSFVRTEGRIPKKMSGNLKDMMHAACFRNSFVGFNQVNYFRTPFGSIEFVLSANSDEITLS